MILFLKPSDNEEIILSKISLFLAERGMNISNKKTQITAITIGFNFLGWHFISDVEGKLGVFPSK
jgi:retron-type reverse transcriptase